MIVENIIKSLEKEIGKKLNFKYCGSRGQNDYFEGVITKLYSNIFIIKVCDNDKIFTKSFSYSDVLSGSLLIIYN